MSRTGRKLAARRTSAPGMPSKHGLSDGLGNVRKMSRTNTLVKNRARAKDARREAGGVPETMPVVEFHDAARSMPHTSPGRTTTEERRPPGCDTQIIIFPVNSYASRRGGASPGARAAKCRVGCLVDSPRRHRGGKRTLHSPVRVIKTNESQCPSGLHRRNTERNNSAAPRLMSVPAGASPPKAALSSVTGYPFRERHAHTNASAVSQGGSGTDMDHSPRQFFKLKTNTSPFTLLALLRLSQ